MGNSDFFPAKIVDRHDLEVRAFQLGRVLVNVSGLPSLRNHPSPTNGSGLWLDTGDIGFKDAQENLHITAREKELAIIGGYNVYLAEVDEVIREYPGIIDATSFVARDEVYGEKIIGVAHCEPGCNVTESELVEYCRRMMGDNRHPKSITFVNHSLMTTSNGKVSRNRIKEIIEEMTHEH